MPSLSLILVNQSTEDIAPEHSPRRVINRRRWVRGSRRLHVECPVGPMAVVMLDIDTQGRLEITSSEDEDAVEALTPKRADEALGECIRQGP